MLYSRERNLVRLLGREREGEEHSLRNPDYKSEKKEEEEEASEGIGSQLARQTDI